MKLLATALGFCLIVVVTAPQVAQAANCARTSTGLVPISDLGAGDYQGEVGGLYPEGSNQIPADHLAVGLAAAAQVIPRDSAGNPDSAGAIGLIAIGVSNTRTEFAEFMMDTAVSEEVNPAVVLVNGAQGSRPLEVWAASSSGTPWTSLESEVEDAGLSPQQVQVAWIKLAPQTRGTLGLEAVDGEVADLNDVVRFAKAAYPNLRLAYLSSRIYGGYGNGERAEPAAYTNGFVVKRLIERQLTGDAQLNSDPDEGQVGAPWLAWGPYMWADGIVPRSDGLTWLCEDFAQDDGIHPAEGAATKVSAMLMDHFMSDPTTATWFGTGGPASATPTQATSSIVGDPSSSTSLQQSNPVGGSETTPSESATEEGSAPALVIIAASSIAALLLLGGFVWSRRRHR